jgi:hypothetical protein
MNRLRAKTELLILAMLAVSVISFSARAAQPGRISWQRHDGQSLAAVIGDKVLWQFHFGADRPKPFFHPVSLTDGTVLTWNSPPDHPWHHGLWFSWKFINGQNYWEPDPQTGKPEGKTEWNECKLETHENGSATIRVELKYRSRGGQVVLREKRRIEASAPDHEGRYHFDWTSTFTAGEKDVVLDRTPLPGEPGGEVYGGYAGLSVRFARALENRNAASTEGPVSFSPQARYRGNAKAMDYHGTIGGRAVGIAICDHPDNLNHPTPWYVIRSNVMSYYSPAVICYQKHTLPAGGQLTLRYRVIVHPDRWNADRLGKEYARFVRESVRPNN